MPRSILLTGLSALVGVLLLSAGPARAAEGRKFALLIGITDYSHDSLPPLKYTEKDVEEMAEALKDVGFSTQVLTVSRGKKNINAKPTTENIKKALKDLFDTPPTRHDTVLIALAGHGVTLEVQDPDDKKPSKTFSYFCPMDAHFRNASYSTGEAPKLILMDALMKELGSCGAGTKLMLVDACRNELKADSSTRSFSSGNMSLAKGMAALFSCKPDERAWETRKLGNAGHGVFFYYVLKGLRGAAKNEKNEIRWSRLAEYVTDRVSEDVPRLIGGGANQTPHGGQNFIGSSPVLGKVEGKKYALLIGVNKYEDKAFPKIGGAENDVRELGVVLRKSGFAADRVVTLTTSTDRQSKFYPTTANIRDQVKETAARLETGDTVLVVYAGIEQQFANDDDYFLCPADAELKAKRGLVSLREVCTILAKAKGKAKLVVVDSCRGMEGTGKNKALTPRLPTDQVGVLFSCSAGEQALEMPGNRNGVMSYFLCEALRGAADANKDGIVTMPELVSYLQTQVPKYVKEKMKNWKGPPQRPELLGSVDDLTFVLKK